jgi:hypothetical protein
MNIFIPSLGRADQASHTWERLQIARVPAQIVIGPEDFPAYRDRFGAAALRVLPRRVKGIGKVRQHLIDNTSGPVLMLDDDLAFFVRRGDDPTKLRIADQKETRQAVKLMEKTLGTYAHAAFAVREGANRCTDKVIFNVRCLRALGYNADVLKREAVRFDRLPVMEDFDVALQLLRKGYESVTINTFLQDQSASNAAGGCSTYRSMEVQAQGAEGLARLHPEFVTVVEKAAKGGGAWATRKDVRVAWKKALDAGGKRRGL